MGPWRAKTQWTVVEFDAPRRQIHRSEGVPFASEFLVTMDVGASVLRLRKSQARKDNERTVQRLAELAAPSRASA